MPSEANCTACSWSPSRQDFCRYESNVKLFYGVSDRGAWSLGSKLILKERSANPPNYEAHNIEFLREKTTIPVPDVVEDWTESNGRYFILTRRIPGEPLSQVWATLSTAEREHIAKQTADYLRQLRDICSSQMQSLNGGPIYSAFLFPVGYGLPHGPLCSDDELWEEMAKALSELPEKVRERLRARMPSATPYTFTHGDLTSVNILVQNGNLAGIIDWEAGGYFPVWWEFTCAGVGLGQEDTEWKTMLRKYMPNHEEARLFWRDFYRLSLYPNLDEHGMALLRELDQ